MSDETPAATAAPAQPACPITSEFLPPNMVKHVDPKAPVPLRMMAAKALVPLSPADMLSVLFMLSYDPDQGVRDQAQKTASALQDRTAASGFRDEEVHTPVLGWFLRLYGQNDTYAEMLILNGNTPDDAVAIARFFKEAGADMIDVSSGQTTREAKPIYVRMYQTPFADRIRNEVGIATLAVGAIFEPDHVNSIIAAGRADLCALGRPHLADPYWTLHAATALGDTASPWPLPYLAGAEQARRLAQRAAEVIRV